ncbi:MAG: tRNA dihydrouridine synthase DusB [Chlamydiia bacterium]
MIKPLTLKKLHLPSNVWYAPLAGCSDYPFRRMSAKYKPGLMFTEMCKMEALVRKESSTYRFLDFDPSMHPIGAQLCGSDPKIAPTAAKIVEDLGFDVVDLNCGCPVDKVTKDGSGSALLKTLDKLFLILGEMVKSVAIPVTVKIRVGWDEKNLIHLKMVELAEAAGVTALTIHGRTREQGYRGFSNRDLIQEAVNHAKSIHIIGNGDIFDPLSAKDLLDRGCSGILVARGTMGKPWIHQEIVEALNEKKEFQVTPWLIKNTLLEHYQEIVHYESPRKALLSLRRVACWYLRDLQGAKQLRDLVNRSQTLEEMFHHLISFDFSSLTFENGETESKKIGSFESESKCNAGL